MSEAEIHDLTGQRNFEYGDLASIRIGTSVVEVRRRGRLYCLCHLRQKQKRQERRGATSKFERGLKSHNCSEFRQIIDALCAGVRTVIILLVAVGQQKVTAVYPYWQTCDCGLSGVPVGERGFYEFLRY